MFTKSELINYCGNLDRRLFEIEKKMAEQILKENKINIFTQTQEAVKAQDEYLQQHPDIKKEYGDLVELHRDITKKLNNLRWN